MALEKITYAGITQNRIKNIKRNIPRVIDYVDRIVIIDAFSTDGTKEWLENYSPKVTVVQRKWDDNFGNQHNEYIKQIKDGWVLVCDDDEIPSEALLKCLPRMIEESKGGYKYCIVSFACHPMEIDEDNNIVADNGPSNFHKEIFFKYNPGMYYDVVLHQCLHGHFINEKRTPKNEIMIERDELYYHLKPDINLWRSACRNWWIAGIWPIYVEVPSGIKPVEWYALKELVKEVYPQVRVFRDFDDLMKKGNIDKRIKDFFYDIKDLPDRKAPRNGEIHGMNELRAYWKYYFERLWPNERIEYEKN